CGVATAVGDYSEIFPHRLRCPRSQTRRPGAISLFRIGRGLGDREPPRALQNLLARPIEPDRVVPALPDGPVVDLAWIAAEMDGHASIGVPGGRGAVDRVGSPVVLLEEALLVVDADRPEGVDGNLADTQRVGDRAVVLLRGHTGIHGRRAGQ